MKFRLLLLTAILAIIPSFTLAAPGDLDPTFGGYHLTGIPQTTASAPFTQMVIQPNGKILLAANTNGSSDVQITLYRFNANGWLDPSFGSGGAFTIPAVGAYNWESTNKMVLQPDGKILVLNANNNGATVFRINSNGSMDTSFAGTGQLTITGLLFPSALRVLSDGKIVVAGSQGQPWPSTAIRWFVARYNSDGTPDSGFGTGGVSNAGSFDMLKYGLIGQVFVEPDGKVLVCGGYEITKRYSVMRFNASGGVDTSFGTNGIATMPPPTASDTAADVERQPDGKFVFVGNRANGWGFRMGRMNSDGSPDTTFGTNGYVSLTGPVISTFNVAVMSILPDGKILTAGYVTNAPDRVDFAVIRFNSDGTLDSARLPAAGKSIKSKIGDFSLNRTESVLSNGLWGSGGMVTAGTPDNNENITSMAVDGVGRVVVAGLSHIFLGGNTASSEVAMARFLSDAAPTANIYGTVRTADGIPIRNVTVVLSEGGLSEPVYALTNQFGLYFFPNLQVTEDYSVSISSKRFNFAVDQQHIILNHDELAVDFTAQP